MENKILDTQKEQVFEVTKGGSSLVCGDWVPQSNVTLPPLKFYEDSQDRRKRCKAYIFLGSQMINKIKIQHKYNCLGFPSTVSPLESKQELVLAFRKTLKMIGLVSTHASRRTSKGRSSSAAPWWSSQYLTSHWELSAAQFGSRTSMNCIN